MTLTPSLPQPSFILPSPLFLLSLLLQTPPPSPFPSPLKLFQTPMGKPKLGVGSSIKALFNLKPLGPKTMTTWVCAQQSKTDSFREVYKSFNSMYYTPSSSSSTTTAAAAAAATVTVNEEEERAATHFVPAGEESFSRASCSSSLSGECSSSDLSEQLPMGAMANRRFFFTPCSTKSILAAEEESGEKAGFCKESVTLAMASEDPYMDFRSSMEEMVVAHGLTDLSCLQELLHCYLRLNDKGTHRFIVLAFVDMLMSNFLGGDSMEREKLQSSYPSCLCLEEVVEDEKGDVDEGKEER